MRVARLNLFLQLKPMRLVEAGFGSLYLSRWQSSDFHEPRDKGLGVTTPKFNKMRRKIHKTLNILIAIFFIKFDQFSYRNFTVKVGKLESTSIINHLMEAEGSIETSILSDLELKGALIVFTDTWFEFFILAPLSGRPYAVAYPQFNTIVISPIEKNLNTLKSGEGYTRILQSVLTHELVHLILKQNYGFFNEYRMAKWANEGLAEFVSNSGSLTVRDGKQVFCNKEELETKAYKYFLYRLAVEYTISQEGTTVPQLVSFAGSLDSVLDRARAFYCD